MADLDLVADIGGTNARFAIAQCSDNHISIRDAQRVRADAFETVQAAAEAYLKAVNLRPKRACFAVAAPAEKGEIALTNSQWRFRKDDIKKALGLERFLVVNDFYGLAAGADYLPEDAFVSVRKGTADPNAPVLVLGPGTGFGQALIVPAKNGRTIVATEGGHAGFAPSNDEETAVVKLIAREYPRVSIERLLSGQGLVNIHRALCAVTGKPAVSLQANEITAAAIDGADPIAGKTVEMFCAVLGAVAGDAVLATGARGGVVLGGGILPKIRDIFLESDFNAQFENKGRMASYVAPTPVKLIMADVAALYGAAAALEGW